VKLKLKENVIGDKNIEKALITYLFVQNIDAICVMMGDLVRKRVQSLLQETVNIE